jgi:hypothetical protein
MWPSNICIGLKYPCDYGTDNYNPICLGINGETPDANEGLFVYPASWVVHKSPSYNTDGLLLIHQCKASLVLYCNCNDSVMKVVRNLRVPTKRSRDILQQAKGITLIESTQIGWFSRWSGGGGWSGRTKLSGGQESQTKGQGTVRLPLKWATAEAARQGASGPNKRATLTTYLLKEKEAKGSSTLKH